MSINRQERHVNMYKRNYMEYQKLIGSRLKLYRINAGLSQQDLQDKSGISVRSISRIEQGSSIQFESLIKVLSALDLDGNLELLIPDQTRRPSYYLEDNAKQNRRVRKKTAPKEMFKWGDER